MKAAWQIAEWEIMKNLRNKQFVIGLMITPLLFLLFASAPTILQRFDRPQTEVYYFIDHYEVEELFLRQAAEGRLEFIAYYGDETELPEVVEKENAAGYFVLDEGAVESGLLAVYFRGTSRQGLPALEHLFSEIIREKRFAESGLDRHYLEYLTAEGAVVAVELDEELTVPREQMMISIAFAAIFFILLMTSSMMLLTSAVQEKKDRMVEIVLSSVSPLNLMQGKITSQFALGLLHLVVWLAFGLPIAWFILKIPVFEYLSFTHVAVLFLYLLLGYMVYAAIFVAIGSTMEDIQNTGNAQGLVMMLPFLPLVLVAPVINNPEGPISTAASLFPLTSPVIMILRTGFAVVPWWQTGVSIAILLVTAALFTALAAKVFRVGMLMYGKNVSMGEMWRWLRYKG